jgi:hypothetical protein
LAGAPNHRGLSLEHRNRRRSTTLAVLAAETGLPRPTVVRLLHTLITLGYASRVSRETGLPTRCLRWRAACASSITWSTLPSRTCAASRASMAGHSTSLRSAPAAWPSATPSRPRVQCRSRRLPRQQEPGPARCAWPRLGRLLSRGRSLKVRPAYLDGELCALNADGCQCSACYRRQWVKAGRLSSCSSPSIFCFSMGRARHNYPSSSARAATLRRGGAFGS